MQKQLAVWALSALLLASCGGEEPAAEEPAANDPNAETTLGEESPSAEELVSVEVPERFKDYTVTESGLRYKVLGNGNGPKLKRGDKVKVNYLGTLLSGEKFDASYDRGEPFELTVGFDLVIEGWNEGLALMSEGDSVEFLIPWNIAYGEQAKGSIPARSDLIFTIVAEERTYECPFDYDAYEGGMTQSGLRHFTVQEGEGAMPAPGQEVKVHYTGRFLNGEQFDSSEGKDPLSFTVGAGQVIQGWEEAVQLIKVGGKTRVVIPFYLAYGERGHPAGIPPYSNLVFDMELVEIVQ